MHLVNSSLVIDGESGDVVVKIFCVISVSNSSEFPSAIAHFAGAHISRPIVELGDAKNRSHRG